MGAAGMPAVAVAGAAAATAAYVRIVEAPDAVLSAAAGTALALAEAFCGQLLVARACEERVTASGGWQRLGAMPVRSIDSVGGLAVGDYAIDIDSGGIGWVRVAVPVAGGRVTVGYTAGLAVGWDAVPEPVRQGVVLLATHLFEHREGGTAPPAAVAALWRPYRRMRLSPERHGEAAA